MSGMGPTVLAMDRHHCTGTWRNVFINVWADDVTLEAARGLGSAIGRLLEQHPRGVAIFGVSRPGVAVVPGSEERRLLSEMLSKQGKALLAVASVIQGDGFVAAAKRTVMSTISLLARQPCPVAIFDAHHDAAAWLAPRLGESHVDPNALLDAIATLEQRYDRYLGPTA
jgi:hypothetical protein